MLECKELLSFRVVGAREKLYIYKYIFLTTVYESNFVRKMPNRAEVRDECLRIREKA